MTLSPPLLAGAAFALAAGLSVVAAQAVTRELEDRSVAAVQERLAADGLGWVTPLGDGLQVVLEGEAPTETARFEAISAAATVVDGARVIDNLRVAEAEALAPPDFAVEILRNGSGVSLIGLVPAAMDREEVAGEIARAAEGQEVTDLLQTADYPVPEGWDPAMGYALEALERLPRSKISVAAGRVSIEAIADSPEEQRRLESELARMTPDGVRLALSVSAPRPVITPFTLRARLMDGHLVFDACSADTEESRDAILSAAVEAGAEGKLECRLGLGTPSTEWGDAVALGLDALGEVGGGTLTFSDADVALVAQSGTDPALFDRVTAELDGALPDVFALEAINPAPAAAAAPQGPPEFVATLDGEGRVQLRGRVEDGRMGNLARAFAQARFGVTDVALATRPGGDGLPEGWSMRVLAGIEALSRLHDGTVTVTLDSIVVAGRTGRRSARDEIATRAIETLGPDAALDLQVAYVEELDPLASLPTPEECLAKITAVTDAAKITFDPGSATISREGEPVIEAIAEILRSCPDLRLRIAGYTDSQGREESNLRLSQERAEAVLGALRAERVPVAGFEAQGYGEASPIAPNETEEGRERNRRIEFTLIGAERVAATEGPPRPDDGAEALRTTGSEGGAAEPLMEQPESPPLRPEEVEARAREARAPEEPEAGEAAPGEATSAAPDGVVGSEGEAPSADSEEVEPEAAEERAAAPAPTEGRRDEAGAAGPALRSDAGAEPATEAEGAEAAPAD